MRTARDKEGPRVDCAWPMLWVPLQATYLRAASIPMLQFIGTWITGQGGDTGTMVVNRNGSLTVDYTYEEIDEEDETFSGTWTNTGSDFTALVQIYNISGSEGSFTESVRFTSDFNSWQDGELVEEDEPDVWTRQ